MKNNSLKNWLLKDNRVDYLVLNSHPWKFCCSVNWILLYVGAISISIWVVTFVSSLIRRMSKLHAHEWFHGWIQLLLLINVVGCMYRIKNRCQYIYVLILCIKIYIRLWDLHGPEERSFEREKGFPSNHEMYYMRGFN